MAETIKGINVVIGAETTGLSKALADVDKKSKSIQSELKQVEKLLKFDPSNVEAIAQKQKLLTEQIEATTERLNRLKAVEQQVQEQFQRGDISEAQYRAFRREIEFTQSALEKLRTELAAMEQEQQRVAISTKQLETLFAATGKSVDDFADVLGDKLANAIKSGKASADQLDQAIEKIAQAALGANVDLEKMRAVLRSVDDGNSLANVRKELNVLGEEASKTQKSIKDIGIELENVAGAIVAGGGLAGAIEKALDVSTLEAKIDVTFDVPEESKTAIEEVIRSIQAYGVDGQEALEGVRRQWALNKEATDEANEAIVRGAAAIASAYEGIDFVELIQETNEIARELNISNEAALALVNALLSVGFPPEQLDIISEYGQQLQRAGFEAQEIQAIFAAGIETGTWNIDNLLDGLKEGRIRLAEFGAGVDDATAQLLEGTKISAEQLQKWGQDVAAGGEKGRIAMLQVTKALMSINDETTRNALGVKIFGTMWEDQGENIAETLLNLDNHLRSAANNQAQLNDLISGLDESPAVKLQQAFQDLLTSCEPLLSTLADIVAKFADWISKNPQLAATLTVIASVLGILVGSAMALAPIFTAIATAAGALGVSIGAIAAPIGIAVAAIAGIATAAFLIIKNWEPIKEFFVNLWDGIVSVTSAAWEGIKTGLSGAWEAIKSTTTSVFEGISAFFTDVWNGIVSFLTETWNGLSSAAQTAFAAIVDVVLPIMEGFQKFFSGVWEAIKNIFAGALLLLIDLVTGNLEALKKDAEAIWNNLKDAFTRIWDGIRQVFSSSIELIKQGLSAAWENIRAVAETAWNRIKTVVSNIVKSTVDWIKSTWDGLLNWFRGLPSQLYTIGSDMFNRMRDAVTNTVTRVKDAIVNGIQSAIDWLRNLPDELKRLGRDMIQGLIDGIKNMVGKVGDAIRDIADRITRDLRDFLGIRSPSRVLMEIGEYTGEGFALGLRRSLEAVRREAAELAAAATGAFGGVMVPGVQAASAGAPAGGSIISFEGMFAGANFYVRSDEDIHRIARELYGMIRMASRGAV